MTSARATETGVLSQGRAAVFEEPIGPSGVRVRERPTTEPSPGAVAVEIRAASINHLDLFLAHGAQRVTPPRVIAADGAGVVRASADPAWRPGDEVVIYPVVCDWECEWCQKGENVRCPRFGVVGEHSDGTACELLHVDARNVFRKPKGLSWEETAAFPLTFLTAWRMLSCANSPGSSSARGMGALSVRTGITSTSLRPRALDTLFPGNDESQDEIGEQARQNGGEECHQSIHDADERGVYTQESSNATAYACDHLVGAAF